MPARARPLDVLYEDDDFLAILKPAGIPVHGGAKTKVATVLARLPNGLRPVHRLDAPTSGVLLLAKSRSAAARAGEAWHKSTKTYEALVVGYWTGPTTIDSPLDDGEGRSLGARTEVQCLQQAEGASHLELRLDTGRFHQIRRHLSAVGHPVWMDDKHGDFGANRQFRMKCRSEGRPTPKHLLLHARRLDWWRPTIEAPTPTRWISWARSLGLDLGAREH